MTLYVCLCTMYVSVCILYLIEGSVGLCKSLYVVIAFFGSVYMTLPMIYTLNPHKFAVVSLRRDDHNTACSIDTALTNQNSPHITNGHLS